MMRRLFRRSTNESLHLNEGPNVEHVRIISWKHMYFFNTIEIHKIKIAKHVYFWWETLILYYDDIYTCFVVLLTWAIFQEVEQKKKRFVVKDMQRALFYTLRHLLRLCVAQCMWIKYKLLWSWFDMMFLPKVDNNVYL